MSYFSLNERTKEATKASAAAAGVPESPAPEGGPNAGNKTTPPAPPMKMSLKRQLGLWVGLFIGVLFSTYIPLFAAGTEVNITFSLVQIALSAVIATMVTPAVFAKIIPGSPAIVQFGIFLQNGVFWTLLIGVAGDVAVTTAVVP